MKKIALALFFAVSIGELISSIIDSRELHIVCKPLLMITLGLYYFFNAGQKSAVVLLAILLSFAGDTTLMFESVNPVFFMVGLGSFLIAHIFYIIAYRQHQDQAEENALKGIQKMRLAFPVVLWGTGLVVVLFPTLGDLKIPVMIYALAMMVMVLNAVFRFGRTQQASFWLVFGGSALFMLSDSLLAINKFFKPVNGAHIWVMVTYILAQFFIIEGLCIHSRNVNSNT
ncbi:lysoplasmalogenase [Chryseolinea sp. H1M3-3]|uniref:lysoplasmalogenase n=1 Tax=Chryseolinea sp. H1M3-3 TaxID=3034144 RepID=UPI0023EC7F49|nr:lysoplasmalogenase [Chryseolinea sp. H1M3-3]